MSVVYGLKFKWPVFHIPYAPEKPINVKQMSIINVFIGSMVHLGGRLVAFGPSRALKSAHRVCAVNTWHKFQCSPLHYHLPGVKKVHKARPPLRDKTFVTWFFLLWCLTWCAGMSQWSAEVSEVGMICDALGLLIWTFWGSLVLSCLYVRQLFASGENNVVRYVSWQTWKNWLLAASQNQQAYSTSIRIPTW